jgi:hypothetical protein
LLKEASEGSLLLFLPPSPLTCEGGAD